MARFTTLYSGSSGNSALVEENGRYLLVDMDVEINGFSYVVLRRTGKACPDAIVGKE